MPGILLEFLFSCRVGCLWIRERPCSIDRSNKACWTSLSEAPGQTKSDSQSISGQLKSLANIECFGVIGIY